MGKNKKLAILTAEDLEDRAAPWTTPVLRDPVIMEPQEAPVVSSQPAGVEGELDDRGPERGRVRRIFLRNF